MNNQTIDNSIKTTTREPLIKVINLNITSNQRTILKNINLEIFDKEIITIIGPNGAGKSTLIKSILGLIKISTGNIIKHSHLKIGYVPQKILFPEQIPIDVLTFLSLNKANNNINNINKNKNKIKYNLVYQQIQDLYSSISIELNILNLLYKNIHTLSGGELQRVLLTKALLNNPNLLILDEPTKSIDLNGQAEFYKLCSHLQKYMNCAILMASHDLYFVMSDVNYVICLNQHICCQGLPDSISKKQEFIEIFGANLNKFSFYHHHHNHQHDINGEII